MKNDNKITPLILAGGSGERLWPLSRSKLPKQFHSINHNNTMLQRTVMRLSKMNINNPIIICNNDHKFIVKDQMLQINKKCEILLEPLAKNTAPAITLAALLSKPDTNLLVLAADHIIEDENIFKQQVEKACHCLKDNKIVVFGIKPTSPNINYGYIETKKETYKETNISFEVKSFKEKPDIKIAKKYFKNKCYFWNSGMFLFKGKTFLNELKTYNSRILNLSKKTVKTASIDNGFTVFDKNAFSKCPNKSIDYAIMEHTKIAVMVPLITSWSDIGTWNSLMEISKKNINGNVIKGDVITNDTKNSIIYSLNKRTIATNGIKNLTIVDTKDALLVSSTKEDLSLKPLVKKIKKQKSDLIDSYPYENRPWGSFESIVKDNCYQVKKLVIKPGGQLSLQKHQFRSEHWVVVSGTAQVIKGKDKIKLGTNESIYIHKNTLHSLKNDGKKDLIIIEVQTGTYLGEDDIERVEDIYGRK